LTSSSSNPYSRHAAIGTDAKATELLQSADVWVLVGSDEGIPRGSTGKVDIRRRRSLLRERL